MIGLRKRWKKLVRRLEGRAHVLMYHRIADLEVDPWQLAVPPHRFDEHLGALAEVARVIPMNELAERVRAGRSVRGLLAITFDDGYADNASAARPLLERHGLPATFFVSTGPLAGGDAFWWDTVEQILLRRETLPRELALGADSSVEPFDLGRSHVLDEERRRAIRAWHAGSPHPNERTAAFHHVWSTLHRLDPDRRSAELERLRRWAGAEDTAMSALDSTATMDADDLRDLVRNPLFDVGAHGVTHVALANVDERVREHEIRESVRTLESLLGRPVRGFAYPNGSHDEATRRAVARAGLRWAVTTSGESVRRGADPFAIGRIHVGDIDNEALLRTIGRRSRSRAIRTSGRSS